MEFKSSKPKSLVTELVGYLFWCCRARHSVFVCLFKVFFFFLFDMYAALLHWVCKKKLIKKALGLKKF